MVYFSAKDNRIYFIGSNGKKQFAGLKSLKNAPKLVESLVNYSQSLRPTSIYTVINKIVTVFEAAWQKSFYIPSNHNSDTWTEYIINTFESWITCENSRAAIETRITYWNKTVEPFLQYLKETGVIPESVLITKTGIDTFNKWDRHSGKLIGEAGLEEVENEEEYDKLLATVDPSQTTDEYLENLMHDLKLKLSKLEKCLELYWQNIKAHYDYGRELISTVDINDIEQHIRKDCFFKYTIIKNMTPQRRHICTVIDKESFASLLYISDRLEPAYGRTKDKNKKYYPNDTLPSQLRKSHYDPFPASLLEDNSKIPERDQVNWCLGVLNPRDIAYIVALIIIKCPKFNFEPLFYSKFKDKHGHSLLIPIDGDKGHQYEFSVIKHRGKESKKEALDPLIQEVFNFLQEKYVKNKQFVDDELGSDFIFLALAQNEKSFTLPAKARIINWITGYADKRSKPTDLSTFFPSLIESELGKGRVSFKAIRATIAVIEWHKTGSIKAASKKIGNSEKVCFDYYLPPQLTEKLNALKVGQFQTALVVAATIDQPELLLKATNFRNLNDCGQFIENLLVEVGDTETPLVETIKGCTSASKANPAKLVSVINTFSLSLLYLFKSLILEREITASELKKNIYSSGLSSFDLFQFSEYLERVLSQHNDSHFRDINKKAMYRALSLKEKPNWKNITTSKGDYRGNIS